MISQQDSHHQEVRDIRHEQSPEDTSQENYFIATRREKRHKRLSLTCRLEDFVSYALLVGLNDPLSYEDAIRDKDSGSWLVIMIKEMEYLHKNHTWDFVKLPKEKRAIDCRWVYRKKE